MQLILIRHGETLSNKEKRIQGISDVWIKYVGIEQAHLLALSLKDNPSEAIHTSPLKRAMQTAEIINEFHRKELHTDKDFNGNGLWRTFEGVSFKKNYGRRERFYRQVDYWSSFCQNAQRRIIDLTTRACWRALKRIINKRGKRR